MEGSGYKYRSEQFTELILFTLLNTNFSYATIYDTVEHETGRRIILY